MLGVTADHSIMVHEPTAFTRERLLVGFNDEVLDMRYVTDTQLAVATNSEHVRVLCSDRFHCY